MSTSEVLGAAAAERSSNESGAEEGRSSNELGAEKGKLLINDKSNWELLTDDERREIFRAARRHMKILLPNDARWGGSDKKGKIIAIFPENNTITIEHKPNRVGFKQQTTMQIGKLFYPKAKPPPLDQIYRLDRNSGTDQQQEEPLEGGYRKTKSLHKKSNKPKKNRTKRRKY